MFHLAGKDRLLHKATALQEDQVAGGLAPKQHNHIPGDQSVRSHPVIND